MRLRPPPVHVADVTGPRGIAVEGVCRLFTRLSVRYYDALYAAKGKDYADEAGRLHKYIQQYKRCASNALLDVACGTGGRLLEARARREGGHGR